tara:strand:- start:147 stop:320 length:174 start_codon:yes stop_codon:yes gene_type:complete
MDHIKQDILNRTEKIIRKQIWLTLIRDSPNRKELLKSTDEHIDAVFKIFGIKLKVTK